MPPKQIGETLGRLNLTAVTERDTCVSYPGKLQLNYDWAGFKAFLAKKSASSLRAYSGYWKQHVAYCWTTMYGNRANEMTLH